MSSRCASSAALIAALALAGCTFDEGGLEPGAVATHADDWRDEVIYQIVVDRFENGDPGNDHVGEVGPVPGDLSRYQGGDWAGIESRLGYLERLGVTALWISPVVENVDRLEVQDGYHGYWASDFTRPNPHFGSVDDLRSLVDEAHARDMLVIVDVVVNHTGRVFFYDFDGDDTMDEGEALPPYSPDGPHRAPLVWLRERPRVFHGAREATLGARHFHRRGQFQSRDQTERELGDFPDGLRDLNTESPELVQMMVDTYARWVEMTDVDGFRLDAVPHVPHSFWSTFAGRLRERLATMGKHRFLLLGEVFHSDPEWLAYYTAGALDSTFDFSLKREVLEGFVLDGFPAETAIGALESYRDVYPELPNPGGVGLSPWQARVAFAESHDMPRLRYWLDDPFAAELAMTIVFTVDAIPSVYYGLEQELDGGWRDASREVMWKTGFSEDTRMFRHIRRLAELRREHRALRRGDLEVRYASSISARESGPGAGLLAYERFTDDERVLVVLNGHPIDDASAAFDTGFAPGTDLCDGLSGGRSEVGADGRLEPTVPPRRARIYLPCD